MAYLKFVCVTRNMATKEKFSQEVALSDFLELQRSSAFVLAFSNDKDHDKSFDH